MEVLRVIYAPLVQNHLRFRSIILKFNCEFIRGWFEAFGSGINNFLLLLRSLNPLTGHRLLQNRTNFYTHSASIEPRSTYLPFLSPKCFGIMRSILNCQHAKRKVPHGLEPIGVHCQVNEGGLFISDGNPRGYCHSFRISPPQGLVDFLNLDARLGKTHYPVLPDYSKYFVHISNFSVNYFQALYLLKLEGLQVNEAIAEVALKKFSGHLWYLSEVLVAFAFFDENVPLETKTKMVQALENEGQEDTLRRITIDSRVIEMSSLEDFVSQNTRKFFSITGLSPDFLEREVVTWESDPEYLHIKNIVSSMRVVNDIAERGIALMEEYNKLRTQNEEQKQYLLLTTTTTTTATKTTTTITIRTTTTTTTFIRMGCLFGTVRTNIKLTIYIKSYPSSRTCGTFKLGRFPAISGRTVLDDEQGRRGPRVVEPGAYRYFFLVPTQFWGRVDLTPQEGQSIPPRKIWWLSDANVGNKFCGDSSSSSTQTEVKLEVKLKLTFKLELKVEVKLKLKFKLELKLEVKLKLTFKLELKLESGENTQIIILDPRYHLQNRIFPFLCIHNLWKTERRAKDTLQEGHWERSGLGRAIGDLASRVCHGQCPRDLSPSPERDSVYLKTLSLIFDFKLLTAISGVRSADGMETEVERSGRSRVAVS
ncbi:unnamed protein product, partial [Nesidiocoris tenuis]